MSNVAPRRFRSARRARMLLVTGVVLVVVALALPALLRATAVTYPGGDFRDTTVHATGTATPAVDPATLLPLAQPGRALPLDLQRRVRTLDTVGGIAVVQQDDLRSVAGLPPLRFTQRYTVDHSTLRNVASAQAYAYTPGTAVDRSPAYSVAFPFGAGAGPYPVWDDAVGQPVTFTFVDKADVGGLGVNRYHGVLDGADVQPALLAGLAPEGLPTTLTFEQLKPQLRAAGVNVDQFVNVALRQLDPPDQQAVNALLAAPIPLRYQVSADSTLLVEPWTGAVVALEKLDETLTERPDVAGIGRIYAIVTQDKYAAKPDVTSAATDLARLFGAPPTTKLLTESLAQTPPSVAATAAAAGAWANQIIVLTVVLPIVVGVLGLLAVVAAWWVRRRGSGREPSDTVGPALDEG